MIQIRRIRVEDVSLAYLLPKATSEFLSEHGKKFKVTEAFGMYEGAVPLAYGGVARGESLVAKPELWALLCVDFHKHLVRNMRILRKAIPVFGAQEGGVWVDNEKSKRFASLLGAVETYEQSGWTHMRLQ